MEGEGIPYDDPRFVEILEACLRVEIGTYTESYDKAETEMKKIKRNVLMKLEKRKELKIKIKDAEDVILMLNLAFQRLREESRETKQRITLIEANIDHRSKLIFLEIKRYKNILGEYQKTWQAYRAEYEQFPLAKKRNEAKVNLKKITIEKMIMEFKIKDLEKKIQMEKKIDEIKMRLKIIEFVKAMTNNEKLKRTLVKLKKEIECLKKQQHSNELELKSLERQEEEAKKERAMKLLEMPPPKINLSRLRLNYSRNWQDWEFKKQSSQIDADSMSVNTIALEEMCIRDETLDGTSKRNDWKNDQKRSTSKITTEKSSTPVATALQKIHSKNYPLSTSFSSNVGSIAKQTSFEQKNKHNRHTTPMCIEEECLANCNESNGFANDTCEPKRMKLTHNDEKNAENIDSEILETPKRSTLHPRVTKIEKVQYGITPSIKRKNTFNFSNTFDYETNASRASSFALNEALMIKDLNASRSIQPSMYGDNSRNFQISDCGNASNIGDFDVNMDSIDADCDQINCKKKEKEASPQVTSRFNFSDLLKLKADNNFRLF
ncbi:PREDICTED: putative uncharacterized protein DDB_G0290989 [Polistes canadensis]|uniref:putative uncharacterized protein DDB_G0290989 n=1 Tax=Polistes canadensis TaxID=91411 RepID=UPI000718C260|nr:PREDICTED: putative uncharacterized protein DDB_G0290989 [Polistes canadensis]